MLISNPLKKRTLNLRGAVILVSLLSISTVLAQTQDTETSTKPGPVETQTSNDTEKRGEFLIAPIPINSPAIGAGLEWAVAYVFPFNKQDKIPPPIQCSALEACSAARSPWELARHFEVAHPEHGGGYGEALKGMRVKITDRMDYEHGGVRTLSRVRAGC